MTVNRVILIGNLVANPEIRNFHNGNEVINFSIATNEKWKGKDGTPQEKVEYHRVAVFSDGLVKIIKEGKNWIRKGTKVYIEGKLQTRKWTDKSGIDKYTTEIIMQGFNCTFQVLSNKSNDSNNHSLQDTIAQEFEGSVVVEEDEDGIPF